MKRTIILCLFCVLSLSAFSQEKVLELKESFSNSNRLNKKSYTFANRKNDDLMLLLEGKEQYAYLLSSDYRQKSKITTKAFSYKFPNIIGHTILIQYFIVIPKTQNMEFKHLILKTKLHLTLL